MYGYIEGKYSVKYSILFMSQRLESILWQCNSHNLKRKVYTSGKNKANVVDLLYWRKQRPNLQSLSIISGTAEKISALFSLFLSRTDGSAETVSSLAHFYSLVFIEKLSKHAVLKN